MQLSPNSSLIRVALVEDDVSFQTALIAAIEAAPDIAMIKVADTRVQGLQMLDQITADVLLVDLGLPDGSGIDVIRAAHEKWPECNIMVSTAFGDEMHVMQSLEAGAIGYLLKGSAPEKMISEIRSMYAGGSPISPLIARRILMRFRQNAKTETANIISAPAKQKTVLSAREKEVLELITNGFTFNEVAAKIDVSRHSVRTYVRRIYAKLEVNSKMEAVFKARKRGVIED